jgi:hypothetical protein
MLVSCWLSLRIAKRLLYQLREASGCIFFRADRNAGGEELSQIPTSLAYGLPKAYGLFDESEVSL